jgi:hypothetical protein
MIFDWAKKLFLPPQGRPAVVTPPVGGISRRTFFSFASVGVIAATNPGMFLPSRWLYRTTPVGPNPILAAGLRKEFLQAYKTLDERIFWRIITRRDHPEEFYGYCSPPLITWDVRP